MVIFLLANGIAKMKNGNKDKLKKNIFIRMKKIKNISGLSLLEALISTLIVGIGFIAILQMTTYSINSIDVSGERTKANYLTNMIAEDVIGHRDKEGNFSDFLSDNANEFVSNTCATVGAGSGNNTPSGTDTGPTSGKLYKDLEDDDASLNKPLKWAALLDNKDYLKCKKTGREIRRFKIFKICNRNSNFPGCNANQNILDEVMFVGRVQMNLNDGKKRKYLYFQSNFRLFP